MSEREFLTIGIESSCDETSAAVLLGERHLVSNVISSQIEIHKVFGGVVPEIASRHHLENINLVTKLALDEASKKLNRHLTFEDVDLIGVTAGPGLVGALVIGIAAAKAYAFACNKPLVGVHHIQAHICANFIEHRELAPPFISLVASGGHTSLVLVKSYTDYELLGQTRDDAIGEAFDKVARVLGLGYPGGPLIDNLAKKGNAQAVHFKRVMLEKGSYDFSFSGIKTAVLNYINTEKQAGRSVNEADVAASFQQAVIDVTVAKAMLALENMKQGKLVLAGGVAANSALRENLKKECDKKGIELYMPSPSLCTDNAAMVAQSAYYSYKNGEISNLSLDAYPNLPIDDLTSIRFKGGKS
ncbi:MAG: tRNA (adenosine(37)-N6)-threonylcarbamoyltransferase complex transferase subunit TsaD [Eubacteriales bacterium]